MSEHRLNDTALRIVVTPSQSSYFAGEPLSVTVTIANTRSPQAQAQVVPPRSTHKRSAHSVSSARLARPPTSPGLPKSPSNAAPPRPCPPKSSAAPTRRGLIGVLSSSQSPPHTENNENDEARGGEGVLGRRIPAKSLSVDIPLHELPNASLPNDAKMSSLRAVGRAGEQPVSSSASCLRGVNGSIYLRRAKLAARVIPVSSLVLHTRPPKSPACSESVHRRGSGFNPAECFGLLVRAHP